MTKILTALLFAVCLAVGGCAAVDNTSYSSVAAALLQERVQQRSKLRTAAEIHAWQQDITRLTDQLAANALQDPAAEKLAALAQMFDEPSSLHYDPLLALQLRNYCRNNGMELAEKDHGSSDTAARRQALQHSSTRDKQQALYNTLLQGDLYSALLLAVLFNDQPKPDLPMAVNSALLAAVRGSSKAQELLLELDAKSHLALPMLVIWQNQLRLGSDLMRAHIDSTSVIIDLSLAKADAPRCLEELMLEDPDAFFLSGTLFRLPARKYRADDLKRLFQRVPDTAGKLPVLVSAALLAGEVEDAQWQLEMSRQLLAHLATDKTLRQQRGNYRAQLLAIMPEVLHYPAKETLADVDTYFSMLWNLAVDIRLNALLALDRTAEAERFLQKYPRCTLPALHLRLERSMVKRFATHLAGKHLEKRLSPPHNKLGFEP